MGKVIFQALALSAIGSTSITGGNPIAKLSLDESRVYRIP
jgi:hypothetical protein